MTTIYDITTALSQTNYKDYSQTTQLFIMAAFRKTNDMTNDDAKKKVKMTITTDPKLIIIGKLRTFCSQAYAMRQSLEDWKNDSCMYTYRELSISCQQALLAFNEFYGPVPVSIKPMNREQALVYTGNLVKAINEIMKLVNDLGKLTIEKTRYKAVIGMIQSSLSVLRSTINEANSTKRSKYMEYLYPTQDGLDEVDRKKEWTPKDGKYWADDEDSDDVFENSLTTLTVTQADSKESMGISGLLGSAADIASKMPGQIGFAGSIAKSVLNIVEPHADSPAQVKEDDGNDLALCDVPRGISSLAYKKVAIHPPQHEAFSSQKECDISERLRQWTLVHTYNWTTTQSVGHILGLTPISPVICKQTLNGAQKRYHHSGMSFFSEFYEFWRGEIDIMVEVVGSQFHQGQLYLAWNPEPTGVSYDQARNLICGTVELSEQTRTVMTIPWINSVPYRRCDRSHEILDHMNGTFCLYVQNALTAPNTVSQSIYVNVWIRAGDGFQFAVPRTPWSYQKIRGTMQSGKELKAITSSKTNEVTENDGLSKAREIAMGYGEDKVPVLASSNLEVATTGNIAGRTYNLGIRFSVNSATDIFGTLVLDKKFPDCLREPAISLTGLMEYHSYYRITAKVTIRINAPPQYVGLYVLVFNPLGDNLSLKGKLESHTQLPHAYFQPAFQSVAEVSIPWTLNKHLLLRTDKEPLGSIQVYCINPLRAPPNSVTKLDGSTWITLLQPYVTMKGIKGAFQSGNDTFGAGATDQQTEYKEPNYDAEQKVDEGEYTGHMNIIDLFKRPTYYGEWVVDDAEPRFQSAFTGTSHAKLMTAWKYWSGGKRIHLFSNCSASNNISIRLSATYLNGAITLRDSYFTGSTFWQPGIQGPRVVQVPYYSEYPALRCFSDEDVEGFLANFIAYPYYHAQPNNNFSKFSAEIWTSMADDFNLYVPLPFPATTNIPTPVYPSNTFTTTLNATEYIKDLTIDGDVEANPGPPVYSQPKDFSNVDTGRRSPPINVNNDGPLGSFSWLTPKGLKQRFKDYCRDQATDLATDYLREFERPDFNTILETLLGSIEWLIDFSLCISILVREENATVRAAAIISLGLKIRKCSSVADTMLAKLQEASNRIWGSRTQAGTTMTKAETAHYTNIAGLIAGVGGAALLGIIGHKYNQTEERGVRNLAAHKFGEAMGTVSKVSNGIKGAKYLWEACRSGIASAVAYFFEGKSLYTNWYEENTDRIQTMIKTYTDLKVAGKTCANEAFRGMLGDRPVDKVRPLGKLAQEVILLGPECKCPPSYVMQAKEIIKEIAKYQELEDSSSQRIEPVGLIFRGNAGCGKSFITTGLLPTIVLMELGLSKNHKDAKDKIYCFPRQTDNQYASGYMSQPWAVIDDFGQSTDDRDFLEIINFISTSCCLLNMADLEDKRTKLTSPFIVCSTNLTNFRNNAVKDMDAVLRRFPVSIEIGFQGNRTKFCPDDYKQAFQECKDPVEAMDKIWTFKKHDFKHNRTIGQLTAKELKDFICSEYTKRHTQFRQFDDLLGSVFQCGDDSCGGACACPKDIGSITKSVRSMSFSAASSLGSLEGINTLIRNNSLYNNSLEREISTEIKELRSILEDRQPSDVRNEPKFKALVADLAKTNPSNWGGNCMPRSFDEAAGFTTNPEVIRQLDAASKLGMNERADAIRGIFPTLNNDDATWFHFFYKLHRTSILEGWQSSNRDLLTGRAEPPEWTGLCAFIVNLGLAASLAYIIIKFIKYLWNSFFSSVSEGVPQAYSDTKAKFVVKKNNGNPTTLLGTFQSGEIDEKCTRYRRNLRRIRIHNYDTHETTGIWGLALDTKHIIISAHFYNTFMAWRGKGQNAAAYMVAEDALGNETGNIPLDFSSQSCIFIGDQDLKSQRLRSDVMLLRLNGSNADNVRNIWKHVLTASEWEDVNSVYDGLLVTKKRGDIDFLLDVANVEVAYDSFTDFRVDCYTGLGPQTIEGDCGQVYVLKQSRPKILLGIHSMLIRGREIGFSPLVLDHLIAARNQLDKFAIPCEDVVSEASHFQATPVECAIWQSPVMPLLGEGTWNGESMQRHSPSKTDLKRSPLQHSEWDDDYAPSRKRPLVVEETELVVHPLLTNAQKYGTEVPYTPPIKFVKAASDYLGSRIIKLYDYNRLSWYDAINGVGTMSSLVMKTSAGYWSGFGKSGKSFFFEELPQEMVGGTLLPLRYKFSEGAKTERFDHLGGKTFCGWLTELDLQLQNGVAVAIPWVSTLKDELRPKAKVAVGKTRVFEQPGLEFTLLFRKYFGHFIDYYRSRPGFKLFHGIGNDKDACWHHYHEELSRWDGRGFDLDYSNYDGSIQPFAFEIFRGMTDAYYGEADRKPRHTLIEMLRHKFHIVGEVLCESFRGNPSGNPVTDIFNSITNAGLILIAWQILRMAQFHETKLEDFDANVRMLTYGDDVIIARNPAIASWFNRVSIAEVGALFGYTITAANKGAKLVPDDRLEDLTFLKSRFVPYDGIVLAPLPLEIIHRELRWEHKANTGDRVVLQQRIDTALRMAVHHGVDVFDTLLEQIHSLGYTSLVTFDSEIDNIRAKQHEYNISLFSGQKPDTSVGGSYNALRDCIFSMFDRIDEELPQLEVDDQFMASMS